MPDVTAVLNVIPSINTHHLDFYAQDQLSISDPLPNKPRDDPEMEPYRLVPAETYKSDRLALQAATTVQPELTRFL
jgi:hypothetical protein